MLNFGISSPVNKLRSTPFFEMTAMRMTPPLLPSREMAKATAANKKMTDSSSVKIWLLSNE